MSHASVIVRDLEVGDRNFAAGYVEGIGTHSAARGEGHGTRPMTEITKIIRRNFELGALSTEAWPFYERLGWERWQGPTFVRTAAGDSHKRPRKRTAGSWFTASDPVRASH